MGNLYLMKFGGNAISGKEDMLRLSKEIAILIKKGAKIVLVHGGGPAISAEMERQGLKPEKVCGVRITDRVGLAVAEDVLHQINEDVIASLEEAGVNAFPVPAYMCTLCKKKAPVTMVEDGVEKSVDLGLVGEVVEVDGDMLHLLLKKGITPVIYPIGSDGENKLNVNADTMAAGIAAGVECTEMIAITDVPGILRDVKDPSSKINKVTLSEIDDLIADGTISGGMIPKVEACRSALLAGVSVVRMVNGKDERNIVTDIMNDVPHGTVIVK